MKTLSLLIIYLLSFIPIQHHTNNTVLNDCDSAKWLKTPADRHSILLYKEYNEVFSIQAGRLKQIIVKYPGLVFSRTVISPDSIFNLKNDRVPSCYAPDFDCEACQDFYYILYGYLLKQRNGVKKHEADRNKLIAIFRTTNGIFEGLEGGGTYFGHQHLRIIGYAEYALYRATHSSTDSPDSTFAARKKAYIKFLKKRIVYIMDKEHYYYGDKKRKLRSDLFKTADKLGGLITNSFYLKSAMQFRRLCYSQYPIE